MLHTFAEWWNTPGACPLELICGLTGYGVAVAGVIGTLVRINRREGR